MDYFIFEIKQKKASWVRRGFLKCNKKVGAPRDKVDEPTRGLLFIKNSTLAPLTIERVANYDKNSGRKLDYAKLAKLHIKQEMTPREIATLLDRSINSIHSALRKIKKEGNYENIN